MKKIQLLSTLLLFSILSFGQQKKHINFDYEAFGLKDSISSQLSFNQTVQQIQEKCTNDTQKLCLIAGWIYNNMDFDLERFYTGGIINDYKTVFSERKGMCGDYSSLFAAFCDRLHIKNEIIEGYVPELDRDKKLFNETNHAWNVVKLGDDWYHCDLLGFSGYLGVDQNGESKFVKLVDTSNFLTQILGYHIPADPIWQLSNYPIPMDTLLKYGEQAKSNPNRTYMDYQKEINSYLQMSAQNKRLTFANHAYAYNNNDSNVIVVEYYNASVDLINYGKGARKKLLLAQKYLKKSRQYISKTTDPALKKGIEAALIRLKKYNL